ncbi:MAG: hypothetical protein KME40_32020 [Komarekiella atlantica HA4396-MV6]|jgi:hypothetical protein|nr:hypothetical protein [Komarekiella atlantica HA4396-MV6]
MHCEGKQKGKVSLIDKGITKVIEINNPPFSVTCTPVDARGRSGNLTYSYSGANPVSQCQNQTREIALYENETLEFRAVPDSTGYDGNRYQSWAVSPTGERLLNDAFSIGCGVITLSSTKFTPSGDNGLVVKDSNGNNLYVVAVSECNYKVSCNEDCPLGQIKCTHNKYPGYCCIPCKSTADKINNLARGIS